MRPGMLSAGLARGGLRTCFQEVFLSWWTVAESAATVWQSWVESNAGGPSFWQQHELRGELVPASYQ